MSLFLTSCFTSNLGKKGSARFEEIYEFSPTQKALRSSESAETVTDLSAGFIDRNVGKWARQRGFKWNRLDRGGFENQPVLNRISRILGIEKLGPLSNSLHSKMNVPKRNRSGCDGYINHGFSDSPTLVVNQPTQSAPSLAQIAKFRFELANVKSDLIHLQEVLAANSANEAEISQITSACTLSNMPDEQNEKNGLHQKPRTESTSGNIMSGVPLSPTESLRQLLKTRTEAMDACLVDNAELRQTIGELTASLKQLQMENESLRQRLTETVGPVANSTNATRTWSFSSESIPNTPCSPPDASNQPNFRLMNGQTYPALS